MKKWHITNPLIKDFSLEYDYLSFWIVDKHSILYEIKIDLFLESANVLQAKKNFYKTYIIVDGKLEIDPNYTIGYVSQFSQCDKSKETTVFE